MKMQPMRMATRVLTNKFFSATIALLLFTSTVSANAQPADIPKSAVVKHLGTSGDSNVFLVQFDNSTGEKFVVTVKDNDGNVLFQESYSDKKFDKKFRLPKEDNGKVTFQIRSIKESSGQNFEINTNTKLVEEVVVKRIN